jgi:NTE family protein
MTDDSNGLLPSPPDEPDEVVANEPVPSTPGASRAAPTTGTALCLSGGGYRAMVFHIGVLWRLNEAGLLPELDRVSSVSGGSITAGVLGLRWNRLDFDDNGVARAFGSQLVGPLRRFARVGVDTSAVLTGLGLPFVSVADRVARAYRKHLFDNATLQDLTDNPRFVINATNVASGVLLRFSKPYLADYRVGQVKDPEVSLAVAVAASSAFPPVLSPCTLDLRRADWVDQEGNDLTTKEFRGRIQLSDGGVYDNLGLQTAWNGHRTLLVSDAGGRIGADPNPARDWARHSTRVLQVVDSQVRALRKRQLIDAYLTGTRDGSYLGIRSEVAAYGLADPMQADPTVTRRLAAIPTRLTRMSDELQEQLINWGYVITDTGLRRHVRPGLPKGRLPYPARPLAR